MKAPSPPPHRHPWRRRALTILALAALGIGLSAGCQTTRPAKDDLSAQEIWDADHLDPVTRDTLLVRYELDQVHRLLKDGRLLAATERLAPLKRQPYLKAEVDLMDREIEQRLERPSTLRSRELSADYAINEVDQRLVLPETYAKLRVITPDTDPYELPTGDMESLLNRRIAKMEFEQADVKTIIQILSQQDNLNIIADDALQSTRTLTVSVKDVKLGEILSYISRNMGIAFHLGESIIWVTDAPAAGDNGPKLITRVFRLHRGRIPARVSSSRVGGDDDDDSGFAADSGGDDDGQEEELYRVLEDTLGSLPERSPDAHFQIYRDRDVLIVRDSLETMRLIEELLRNFDQAPVQVLIEARFVTIGQDALKQLGTSINSIKFARGGGSAEYSSILPAFATAVGGSPQLAVSGIIDNVTYDAVLQAMEQSGKSRTLSAPRLTVMNNQQGSLRRGENRFYFREFELETTGGDVPVAQVVPSGDAEELELGITLNVRPSVGHDRKTIMLSIFAGIEEFIEFVELAQDISLPRTDENSINTMVAVNSGQTLVMGGQLALEDTEGESRTPVLGSIPVLGTLFSKKEKSVTPNHLLIFVTATLIDPDGYLNVTGDSAADKADDQN